MIETAPKKVSICPPGFIWVGDFLISINHIVHIEPLPKAKEATLCLVNGDKIVCTQSSVVDFAKVISAQLAPTAKNTVSEDPDAKERWPQLTHLLNELGTLLYDIERRMDLDLSGDSHIEDDARFEQGTIQSILVAARKQYAREVT